jgi:sulfide:quinone oxidoreductase
MRPEEVLGLRENAETIWTPREMLALRLALYEQTLRWPRSPP